MLALQQGHLVHKDYFSLYLMFSSLSGIILDIILSSSSLEGSGRALDSKILILHKSAKS